MVFHRPISVLNRRTNSSPPTVRRVHHDFTAIIEAKKYGLHDRMTQGHAPFTPGIAQFTPQIAPFTSPNAPFSPQIAPFISPNRPLTPPMAPFTGNSPVNMGQTSGSGPVTTPNEPHRRAFPGPTLPIRGHNDPVSRSDSELAESYLVRSGPPAPPYHELGQSALVQNGGPSGHDYDLSHSSLEQSGVLPPPCAELGRSSLVQNGAPSDRNHELARSSLVQSGALAVPDCDLDRSALVQNEASQVPGPKVGRSALVKRARPVLAKVVGGKRLRHAAVELAKIQRAARDQAESGSSKDGALQAARSQAVVNHDLPDYAPDGGDHLLPNPPAKRRRVNQPLSSEYVDDSDADANGDIRHMGPVADKPKQNSTSAKHGKGGPQKAVATATTPAAPGSGKGKGRATSVPNVEAQTQAQPAQPAQQWSGNGVNAPPSQGVRTRTNRVKTTWERDQDRYSDPMSAEAAKASPNKQNYQCICCGLYKPKDYHQTCFGYTFQPDEWLCKNCHSGISARMKAMFGKGVKDGAGRGYDLKSILRGKVIDYRAYIERRGNITVKTKQTGTDKQPKDGSEDDLEDDETTWWWC